MKKTPDRLAGYQLTKGSAEEDTEAEIPGKYGRITLFDDSRLSVFVEGSRRLHKVAAIPGASLFTEGEGEGTVHVPDAALPVAAAIIGAKKRRRVTEERRGQLKAVGASSRFRKNAA